MTKDAGRGRVLRRRVDAAEAAYLPAGPLACTGCGTLVGDYHDDDCPGNDYRLIAGVNGVPVLVEWPNGDYEAPQGLEGIVAYLEGDDG